MTNSMTKIYKYGMRIRGFSIGCQPMEGFIERLDDPTGKYFDIITYSRELTAEEIRHYSLDYITDPATDKKTYFINFILNNEDDTAEVYCTYNKALEIANTMIKGGIERLYICENENTFDPCIAMYEDGSWI